MIAALAYGQGAREYSNSVNWTDNDPLDKKFRKTVAGVVFQKEL